MKSASRLLAGLAVLLGIMLLSGCSDDDSNPFAGDCVDNTDFVASETFSYRVPLAEHVRFKLEGINGNIEITGVAGADSVSIEGERSVGSESIDDAEEHLPELEVSVSDMGTEVFVETIQPEDTDCRSFIVDYEITLPESLNVYVDNTNGTITVTSMRSTLDVGTTNGQITLDDFVGSTDADVTNGQIVAEVTLPQDGEAELTTVNGSIVLWIPDDTSAEFSAEVVQGTITIDDSLVLDDAVITNDSVTGTLGDGEGTIDLRTVNGSMSVLSF